MAIQNPVFYKGPLLQKEKRRAKDGMTFKAGGLCRLTDSGVVKVKLLGSSVYGLFSQTQSTATSSTDIWIERIPSSQTQFIMGAYSRSTGTDAIVPATEIGKRAAIGVNDSLYGAAIGVDTGVQVLRIHARFSDLEKGRTDTSDTPGYVIASFVDSALTTVGAGM